MKTIKVVRQRLPKAVPVPIRKGTEAKAFAVDMTLNVEAPETKSFDAVKNGDVVVDYRNVTIKGYLSTWQHVTPSDRDGDYVVRGAFLDTIPRFMQNPVLLVNHRNTVDSIAGKFTAVREDDTGLYVEAQITDSPAEWAKDVRWKVANGELRTLSMGGYFYRGEDERAIVKVSLYEGSLTPVPSNPDATFSVREITDAEEQTKALAVIGK